MSNEDKTREQLINELATLRQRIADLESSPSLADQNGRQTELLLALNTASASIEQSIYSEAQVLEAFRRQILQLGLYGGIGLLDETGERLIVQITAHPGKMLQTLRKLEKRVGVRTEGYSFAFTQADTYRQVVETGETLFVPDGNPTIRQLLPEAAQPFAGLILKAFPPMPTIYAPLKAQGTLRGIINISGKGLTPADVPAVAAFASHLAVALDNAHLFGEREQAHRLLLESEEKYRSVVESATDAIVLADAKGTIVAWNKAASAIFGCEEAEILGQPVTRLIPERYLEKHRQGVNRLQTTGESRLLGNTAEVMALRKNGREFPVEISLSPWGTKTDPLYSAIVRDITERKQAEEALRQSEEKYRMVMEQAADGIFLTDPEGNFIDVNRMGCQMAGYVREELLTMHLRQLAAPETRERQAENIRQLKQGSQVVTERQILTKDGRRKTIEINAAQLGNGNLMGIMRDITERKQAEAEIQQRTEDLTLINLLNLAINRGDTLQEVLQLLSRETKRIFSSRGAVVYLLSADKKQLVLPYLGLSSALKDHIETVIGKSVPAVAISLSSGSLYLEALQAGIPQRIDNPATIQRLMAEHTEDERLRKLIPAIYRLLGIGSVILAPLVAEGEPVGLLSVSRREPFAETDLARFEVIAEQLTAAIREKQMEEALQASEVRFRTLFERSPDGIFLMKPEDVPIIVEANQAACEMHGYTQEVIGQPISFLDSSDDVALIPERMAALQAGESVSFEATHVRKDGVTFPVDVLAALLDIGEQRFVLSIERDITERKQGELEREAAREYGQVLNQALFQLTAGDISAGLEGILEHVCQHLGLPGGWVIIHKGAGAPYQLAAAYGIPPMVQRAAQAHFPQTCYCIESPATWSDEYVVHVCGCFLALGETRHMLTVPLVLEEQPLGVVDFLAPADLQLPDTARSFLENMTQSVTLALSRAYLLEDLQKLNAALKAEQERLDGLVSHLPEGVILLDDDRRLLLANPAARLVLAVLAPEMADGARLEQLGQRPLEEILAGYADSMPMEITRPGPPKRVFEAQAQPVGDKQWMLVVREVTREREIQRQAQAQERLAAVGQLAAGIAHDFNNIMGVIVLYTDLMGHIPDLPANAYERLAIIKKQGRQAANLIQQILAFSRKSLLKRQPLDLLPLLKELKKLLVRTLPETIALGLDYKAGTYLIDADPTHIQQVFMNLALNARDAMPEGGRLWVELAPFRLEADQMAPCPDLEPGDWVRIVVSDTGTGMSPDVRQHIFDPFFTTKAPGKGTGLGLAQAHGIIGQHGGCITVASQVGEGTTFTIYLPRLLMPDDGDTVVSSAPTLTKGQGETILVVEDDAKMRQAVCDTLQSLNYQVLQAADGEEALGIYEQQGDKIAAVLSDVVMPRMGGMALYTALKERNPTITVVLVSGYPLDDDARKPLANQPVEWLHKPVSPNDLAEALSRALQKGRK